MSEFTAAEDRVFASVLRERATKLYRRADSMPLDHGNGSMDRHAELKEKAAGYMAEAERLDPLPKGKDDPA